MACLGESSSYRRDPPSLIFTIIHCGFCLSRIYTQEVSHNKEKYPEKALWGTFRVLICKLLIFSITSGERGILSPLRFESAAR